MLNAMERTQNTTFWVASMLLLVAVQTAICYAQNCGCASGLCCSKFGYCGTGDAYCGDDCQSGPCTNNSGGVSGEKDDNVVTILLIFGSSGNVASIATETFFDGLSEGAASSCEGKRFYSYNAFITAANAYGGFCTTGSTDVRKREIAAFFAHVLHETEDLCYINEVNSGTNYYCSPSQEWPCASGKNYHGRGPLQLSWNYNYGAAGKNIGFDGINNPDLVAQDATVAFKTATWFWMNNCHNAIISGKGFGYTIRAINSMECDGGNPEQVRSRVAKYRKLCSQLGIDSEANVSC